MQSDKIAIYSGIFLGTMLSMFILFPVAFGDTFFLIQKDGSTPIQSCTESNGFVLAQNLTDLCDVVIITPMNNEVLQYNGSFWVNAVVTGSDDTVCANVGAGAQVFKDGECNFRTIIGSPDISVVQNLNEIVIDFNGTGAGDTTACINVGTGTAYSCVEGTNVNLRSLLAGTGMSITNNTNTITITNTAPDNTVCANVGVGDGIYKDGECNFKTLLPAGGTVFTIGTNEITIRSACQNVGSGTALLCGSAGTDIIIESLIAGTGITITDTTDDWTFASQCANTGTGEAVCESSNNINSLIAGTSISITDTTGDLTIANTSPDLEVDQLIHLNLATVTMTNIGTSYVDIYTSAFSSETLFHIDCNNVSDLRIFFAWDYVGTGNQQTRWVDVADNTNVLYESTTFTTDQDVYDSGWFTKPVWCISTYEIEQQGKSSVGTDDPIPRVYAVHVR